MDKKSVNFNFNSEINELIAETLRKKWHPESGKDTNDKCVFCKQCFSVCSTCLCPPLLCRKSGRKGFLAQYVRMEVPVRDLGPDILAGIKRLFLSYCKKDEPFNFYE